MLQNSSMFSHSSGILLYTSSLKHLKTSRYNSLFTVWPCETTSQWTFYKKNLMSDQFMQVFFWPGQSFPHTLQQSNNIGISINKPMSHWFDMAVKFFGIDLGFAQLLSFSINFTVISTVKQFLTNTSLFDYQSTTMAQKMHITVSNAL